MSQYPTNLISTSSSALAPLELTVSGPGWDGDERHVFEQPFVLVGRDERCCLRLDDDAISRRHTYLQQLGERVFCVDLGSRTGTRWAGKSHPSGWLLPNDGIQIGPFTLELANGAGSSGVVSEPGAEAGNPLQDRRNDQPGLPSFRIAVGNEVRSQFRMNRDLVLVGSGPECRVRLRDAGISRYHCSLVRTPDGLWVVDLLSATGTRLNGEPIRWARVNEGDLLRVGQYLLRLGYEGEGTAVRSTLPPEYRMEAPVQRAEDLPESGRQLDRVPALQGELDQLRERLRDTELLRQHLADRETECVRLREQAGTFDKQSAELAELKARLEVAETMAGKLEEIGSERDHWQTRTQALQSEMDSSLGEREDLRQQLEAAQQQLAEEREAVRAAKGRLDEQSATLQQLQQAHEELARERDKTRELQGELDQVRHHQQDAESLRQQLTDARSKHDEVGVRVLELESRAASVDRLADRIREAEEESQQLRERLQTAQSRMTELEDLKGQLDSAAGKLEEVCRERDRWQSETQSVQGQIESGLAEREELRQRLEAAQQQHAEKDEAVRAANARLDQQSAILQQLQETHQELARAHDKTRQLLAELDQARHHQQDAEALRQQLADAQSKHDELAARVQELEGTAGSTDRLADRLRETEVETERLRHQVRVLELRVAEADDLIARLESAESDAGNLEEVRSERDHWQVEAETLRNRIASELVEREQLVRLTEELLAVQAERDRLLAEQQTSAQQENQEFVRASDLERALAEANAAYEKALSEERAGWESERQALKTLIEQARTADHNSAQAMIRDIQARFAAERQELKMRLEGAEAQIIWERGLSQEQSEQLRRQVVALQAERDRLVARQAQPVSFVASAGERSQDKVDRPVETNPVRQLTMQDQALALFFGLGVGHPHEQSARAQSANRSAETARPRIQSPGEGSQQAHLPSIEQGVEDAWTQAAARRQASAIQAEAAQASNPPEAVQENPATAEDEQPGEIAGDWSSQSKDEEQSGLWRKIINLVRRK